MQIVHRTVLIILLCNVALVGLVFPQAKRGQTDKLRQSAEKLVADPTAAADIRLVSGKKMTGRISSVASDSITFIEKSSPQPQTIALADVARIEKHKNGMTKGSWIAIGAIAGGVVIVLVALCPVYSWSCR